MSYANYEDYVTMYGAGMDRTNFNRLAYDASALIDSYVTTVDGVNKLRYFFPTDEYDVQAVKRCVCALISSLHQLEEIESASSGIIVREDGTVTGRAVTSISSGSESMSFSAVGSGSSLISAAAKSEAARNELIASQVFKYLRGHKDKNGINLLFVGVYPDVPKNSNVI